MDLSRLILFLTVAVGLLACKPGTTSSSNNENQVSPSDKSVDSVEDKSFESGKTNNGNVARKAHRVSASSVSKQLSNVSLFSAQPGGAVTAKAPAESPMQLTGSDGTGLELRQLKARAVVDGPLAFTELHMTFHNPENRRREGRFKLTLPAGAAVSRFAMKINGHWMEGEVVEKQRARRIYEDFLHRRQDPAILEQDAGNTFRARVFPIEAKQDKHIIVSFSQELTDQKTAYRLPLNGLPKLNALSVRAFVNPGSEGQGGKASTSMGGTVSQMQVVSVNRKDYQPTMDFEVYPSHLKSEFNGLRHDNIALARVAVDAGTQAHGFANVEVLFDTSASQSLDFERRLERLEQLVKMAATHGAQTVNIVAFDQGQFPVYSGAPSGFGSKHIHALRNRAALGASDLMGALAALKKRHAKNSARLIILTNGVSTVGQAEVGEFSQAAAALKGAGIERLDVVTMTSARDDGVLAALVGAGLKFDGVVVDAKVNSSTFKPLVLQTFKPITVSVPGAKWVWPQTFVGLQAGQQRLVFADLPKETSFKVELSGGVSQTIEPKVRKAEKPLLERAWIKARIGRLMSIADTDPDMKAAYRQQVIKLSTKYRVLSPLTALLVLETEHDYRRYSIERTALADILSISPEGIAVREPRKQPTFQALKPARTKESLQGGLKNKKRGKIGRSKGSGDNGGAERVGSAPPSAPAVEKSAETARHMVDADRAEAEEEDVEASSDTFGGQQGRAPRAKVRQRRIRPERRPRPRPRPVPPLVRPETKPVPQVADEASRKAAYAKIMAELDAKKAVTGRMAKIESMGSEAALTEAWAWHKSQPTDVLAYVALGNTLAKYGQTAQAARAYGSLLDLYPSRADLRRYAGNLLESLGHTQNSLAEDTYSKASTQRPDHPSVYHMHAMNLAKQGKYLAALDVLAKGLTARRRTGNFRGVEQILREDMGIIAAAYLAQNPKDRSALDEKLRAHRVSVATKASLRVVLTWETDANDVDFHIFDRDKHHASYSNKALYSGGRLFADITSGYGPECFAVEAPKAFPYEIMAHYYSRGPMGYGMGRLQVIRHDGKGGLGFMEKPFVIMNDGAWVTLGKVTAKSALPQ